MGLWGKFGSAWYRVKEYYYDARLARRQQTDQEYARRLAELAGGREIEAVIVDPSAASFLETLRREGWNVRKADNEVLSGIRRTADALKREEIVICEACEDAIREFGSYCWDLAAGGPGPGAEGARPRHGRDPLLRGHGGGPGGPGGGLLRGGRGAAGLSKERRRTMKLWNRRRKEESPPPAPVQLRPAERHPLRPDGRVRAPSRAGLRPLPGHPGGDPGGGRGYPEAGAPGRRGGGNLPG